MTALRDFLVRFGVVILVPTCAAGLVVVLASIMPPREERKSPTEINFRAACDAAKGTAVWNGRHWECVK